MRFLTIILILISLEGFSQSDSVENYTFYRYNYGTRLHRSWADSIQHIPRFKASGASNGAIAVDSTDNEFTWKSGGVWYKERYVNGVSYGSNILTLTRSDGATLTTTIVSGGTTQRFAYPSEDETAGENRSFNANHYSFGIDSASKQSLSARTDSTHGYWSISDTASKITQRVVKDSVYMTFYQSYDSLYLKAESGTATSTILVKKDSIRIKPFNGRLFIDTLLTSSEDSALVYNPTTKKVTYRAIPYVNAATYSGTTLTLTRNDGGTVTTTIAGGGTDNANVGSGFRILKPATQELKTLFAGTNVTIDSTTNTDGLTITATDRYLTGAAYSGGTLTLTLSNGATVTTTISAGSTYGFYNGLTDSASTGKVVLGGTLWKNTTIEATNSYNLTVNGSTSSTTTGVFAVNQTAATGYAIYAQANSSSNGAIYGKGSTGTIGEGTSIGVWGNTTNGRGVYALATTGNGLMAYATTGIPFRMIAEPATSNSVASTGSFERVNSGGAGANGIGGSFDLKAETSSFATSTVGQIIWKWTDATAATRTGQLEFATTRNATTATRLIITDIPTYADEAAASAASLATGTMYKTSTGQLMIKL